MIFTTKFDIHSVIHFVGCYALVPTFMAVFGVSVGLAAFFAFIAACVWEVLDEFNFRKMWKKRFLDPRGGDYLDLITDAVGILLAFWIF